MNERIKQLAEQAFFDEATSRPSDRMYTFSDHKMAKFAELIVRECYVHCGGQLMDKNLAEAHGLTYNDGVMDCAIGLLHHFGVEE